jgi:hypothetical protein
METNNNPSSPVNPQSTPARTTNWFDAMHIITYVIVLVGLGLITWQIYAYVNNQQTGSSAACQFKPNPRSRTQPTGKLIQIATIVLILSILSD